MSEVVELAKRRGFLYPSFEIYGGVAGFWDYGPLGSRLKNNILDLWRDIYVLQEGFEEIDTPTIGKRKVFEASGHASGFSDFLIRCRDCGEFYRADHLVEKVVGIENADGLSKKELSNIIQREQIECDGCSSRLEGEVEDFNLMFETQIGPSGDRKGFLRPETAQGIFIDFKRLKRYFREKLPFGVSQIGKAYRNEINPRQSVVRLREFQQAEVEFFKHPEQELDIEALEDVEVRLYPIEKQETDDEAFLTTVGESLDDGLIESETIAYFIARSQQWYEDIGIDMSRLRFRQHLPEERAHYATDCWDGEALTEYGWIELNGIADRGSYDLLRHEEYSGEEFSVFQEYDEAVVKEKKVLDPDMSVLGPKFGEKTQDVVEELERLKNESPEVFSSDEIEVEIDGETFTIDSKAAGFDIKKVRETGKNIVPQVIEPSYGIDRIVYTILEHSFDKDTIDGEQRNVLRLPSYISPIDVAVLPLVSKDGLDEMAKQIEEHLRKQGFMVKYDDSGAIGRRYRRQDEIGTPFVVTVDYDSLEDDTVTLRNRDTTKQERVERQKLVERLNELKDSI